MDCLPGIERRPPRPAQRLGCLPNGKDGLSGPIANGQAGTGRPGVESPGVIRKGVVFVRKTFLFALVILAGLGCRQVLHSQSADLEALEAITQRFSFVVTLEGDPLRYLYADAREHVHLYKIENGKSVLEWESTNLSSRASAIFVTDLDVDGRKEIVIATVNGRILIYDANNFELLWENLQDPFDKIDCMVAANIDGDPQEELIFVANSFLYIYDGQRKSLEWQSQREFDAQELLLGNVDDDDQLELIMNTGLVFDTRFYSVEFESEERFGDRIRLFDTNGDGIPEIIGENTDFTVRIFDIYAERELW